MMKISKSIFSRLIALTFVLVTFAGCDEEGNLPEAVGAELFGVWTVTSAVVMNCDDPDDNGSFGQVCTTTDCLKVEFKADGTFVSTEIEDGVTTTEDGTFEISGDQLTINQGTEVEIANFEIVDGVLKLSGSAPETGCEFTTSLTKGS